MHEKNVKYANFFNKYEKKLSKYLKKAQICIENIKKSLFSLLYG